MSGRGAISESQLVVILALLMGLQPVTTDLFLPTLPALTEALSASAGQAQLAMSGVLLAFGVSQLWWGPLSDRIGRRPVLLAGLLLHGFAGVLSAAAPVMEVLLAGRILQGFALGAAVACARAIVRDSFSGTTAVRVLGRSLSGVGLLAALAVPVGGMGAQYLGWRVTQLLPGFFALVTCALVWRHFPESLRERNPAAMAPRQLLRNWANILGHPRFQAFTALNAASMGGLFCLLASSSFVFIGELSLSPLQYGGLMATVSLCFFLGTLLCRALLQYWSLKRVLLCGGALSLGSSLLMTLQALLEPSLMGLVAACYLFMLGHGIHHTCGQSGSVAAFPFAAGTASALNGFILMLVAFACGAWLAPFLGQGVTPLLLGVGVMGAVAGGLAWTLLPAFLSRHGA